MKNRIHVGCTCCETRHFIQFDLDEDDPAHPRLYVYPQMAHYLSWPKKILQSLKYIFGIYRDCDLDCVIVGEQEAQNIISICTKYLETSKNRITEEESSYKSDNAIIAWAEEIKNKRAATCKELK